MSVFTVALLALAALCAGTVNAVAGGGGLITLPALLAAGLPPHLALATNKGQSVWGSGAAMVAFWRAGRVDRRQARYAFPLALVGSAAGATLVSGISKDALRPIVIGLLIGATLLLIVRTPTREHDAPAARWWAAALLALVIGAYDGFFGPGTGTFLIVGFVALCGRSLVHASADAKVVNFASNLAAVAVFSQRGAILWQVSLPMAIGQLVGGLVGAQLAMRGGARVVRLFVVIVSGALIVKLGYDLLAGRARPAPLPRVVVQLDCGDRERELVVTGDLRLDDAPCGAPWDALELEAGPRTELVRAIPGREVWLRRARDRAFVEVRAHDRVTATFDHVTAVTWSAPREREAASVEVSVGDEVQQLAVDELRRRFAAGGKEASLCQVADALAGAPARIVVTGEAAAPVVIERADCERRGLVLRFGGRGGVRLRDREGAHLLQDVHRIAL